MAEEKIKKLIVSTTVAAVTLLFVLLVFLVYQIISISVRKHEIAELKSEIAYYQELIDSGNLSIEEQYTAEWWLEKRAWELGMKYPNA